LYGGEHLFQNYAELKKSLCSNRVSVCFYLFYITHFTSQGKAWWVAPHFPNSNAGNSRQEQEFKVKKTTHSSHPSCLWLNLMQTKLAKYNVSILQEEIFHDDDRYMTWGHHACFFFALVLRGMKGVADGRRRARIVCRHHYKPLHHLFKANVLFKISVYAL
jgi:hypothetical protein